MKVLKASYEILDQIDRDHILKKLEQCGRECYQSTHKVTEGSAGPFVSKLVELQHLSVLEHFSFTVHFAVDRGVTHEQVRHRLASFSQESTRYCNYDNDQFGNEIKVIDIREGIKLDTKMKDMSVHLINEIISEWERAMEDAERHYCRMIQLGATPQMARSVLPSSLKAGITISANLREWMLILTQRCSKAAHPQIREVMLPLLAELVVVLPEIFGRIPVAA
jgi:thymidylate synthase, flavin-dependent